jgi:glycine oxidase
MRADILIVGQGLAGTMLAWACERSGIGFCITDHGHAASASAVAAGIINPITGRRLVKSWRIDSQLPAARAAYREIEDVLGVRLWHDLRIRRRFADERERVVWREKQSRGELAPYGGVEEEDGAWISGAARVDLLTLLRGSRARWEAAGRLCARAAEPAREREQHDLVIDCRGLGAAQAGTFAFVPWEFSKGETLELAVEGLAPDVALNRRHWLVPFDAGTARVGATHEPGRCDAEPTAAARALLETSAQELLGAERNFSVIRHLAGVRVTLGDKRPAAGRHPDDSRLGLVNGLGGKGALWAPMLARQWVNHLTEGIAFDAEIDVKRFAGSIGTSGVIRG